MTPTVAVLRSADDHLWATQLHFANNVGDVIPATGFDTRLRAPNGDPATYAFTKVNPALQALVWADRFYDFSNQPAGATMDVAPAT